MRRALCLFLVLSSPACGHAGATPEPRAVPVEPAAPEATPEQSAPPPRARSEAPPPDCPDQHAWDDMAQACRMFPGGGYGWAGCSLATAPPNGDQCITGTHWHACDCVCDADGTKWNAMSQRCE